MLKKVILIFFISTILILAGCNITFAASSSTYFYGEAIKIEDENVEILSDEITIDTNTSKVENVILLKNTSQKEITTSINIPLENKQISTFVNNVSILINGTKVDYTTNDNGEYIVKTKIPAGSGKRIEISYNTENDLQKAKVIKYNFENFENRTVKKVKVNVVIDEKNIPLVEKIYPGHYKFADNTISVEYYNYTVNVITKEVIVQKQTFNDLLYGRETDLTDEEKNIISTWMNNLTCKKNEIRHDQKDIINNILTYAFIKNGTKSIDDSTTRDIEYYVKNELIYDIYINKFEDANNELKGKTICVAFIETEGDLELYANIGVDLIEEESDITPVYRDEVLLTPERKILKAKNSMNSGNLGARVIFVGEGINGEDLNATEEEIGKYINSINADMYIRVMIYDNKLPKEYSEGIVGYYNNENCEIAKAFCIQVDDELITEQQWNNIRPGWPKSLYDTYEEYVNDYGQFEGHNIITEEQWNQIGYTQNTPRGKYDSYENYVANYYNDYYKETLVKLSNPYVENSLEVPTVAQFIAYRQQEDGKYMVKFFGKGYANFYNSVERGLITSKKALETTSAKNLISANRQKNENIKNEVEGQISSIEILNNELEIQKSIKDEAKEENIKEGNLISEKANLLKFEIKDILVFAGIGILIIICIIVLIVEHKKKKRRLV